MKKMMKLVRKCFSIITIITTSYKIIDFEQENVTKLNSISQRLAEQIFAEPEAYFNECQLELEDEGYDSNELEIDSISSNKIECKLL